MKLHGLLHKLSLISRESGEVGACYWKPCEGKFFGTCVEIVVLCAAPIRRGSVAARSHHASMLVVNRDDAVDGESPGCALTAAALSTRLGSEFQVGVRGQGAAGHVVALRDTLVDVVVAQAGLRSRLISR